MTAWLERQPPAARAGIDRLRAIVARAAPHLEESIKWNAPSFADGGADRVTLGLERKGGWRVVLHRGAGKGATAFAFEDKSGLARWPAPDRGVIQFADMAAIDSAEDALEALVRGWIARTAAAR